jgi:hypothetical protein
VNSKSTFSKFKIAILFFQINIKANNFSALFIPHSELKNKDFYINDDYFISRIGKMKYLSQVINHLKEF